MFRILAYLAPLAAGFGVAAALALTADRPLRRRALAAASVLGVAVLLLGIAALGGSFVAWIKVSILLAAFCGLVAGLYLLCESCGLPREASQIVSGLAVVALMSTVFWAGPLIRDSDDQSLETTYPRITRAIGVNPFLVMGYSIFDYAPLHTDGLRGLGLHDYQFDRPHWGSTSGGYALFGLLFAGAAWAIRALRGRKE